MDPREVEVGLTRSKPLHDVAGEWAARACAADRFLYAAREYVPLLWDGLTPGPPAEPRTVRGPAEQDWLLQRVGLVYVLHAPYWRRGMAPPDAALPFQCVVRAFQVCVRRFLERDAADVPMHRWLARTDVDRVRGLAWFLDDMVAGHRVADLGVMPAHVAAMRLASSLRAYQSAELQSLFVYARSLLLGDPAATMKEQQFCLRLLRTIRSDSEAQHYAPGTLRAMRTAFVPADVARVCARYRQLALPYLRAVCAEVCAIGRAGDTPPELGPHWEQLGDALARHAPPERAQEFLMSAARADDHIVARAERGDVAVSVMWLVQMRTIPAYIGAQTQALLSVHNDSPQPRADALCTFALALLQQDLWTLRAENAESPPLAPRIHGPAHPTATHVATTLQEDARDALDACLVELRSVALAHAKTQSAATLLAQLAAADAVRRA
ncbi:hypothetical protein MSPP1_000533 [Malassezia sp. CBS 17886]|nr:hypothetical protein MSPP1_000533 [Malassezia sp. CBS 17886]